MKNKLSLLALPILAATALAFQGQSKPFEESSNGKEVTVKVGQTFSVKLPNNPTTGYSLFLLTDGHEPWTLASRNYKQSPAPAGTVGVGGHETFIFKATKAGNGQVAILAARGFDLKNTLKSASPFILKITVK